MPAPCPYKLQKWPYPIQKYQFHPKETAFHLSRAFALFTQEINLLQETYIRLQEKWVNVNKELIKNIAKLNQLTSYCNHIIKNINQGILWMHLDGTIQLMNQTALIYLGVTEKKVLHQKIENVLPQEILGFSIKEALKFGLAPKIVYKTLNQKTLEISTFFIYEGAASNHGLMVLLKDITHIEELQYSLQRNSRLNQLGEMVATIAHEIRNPLGGIRGYSSLLAKDLQDSPHLQEMAHFILEGSKHLETLVTSVLQYARPVQMQIEPIELRQFLKQWAKSVTMDPAFPDTIKLQLHIPFSSFLVYIDPQAIKSALLNLAFNAIQAMPSGGLITVATLQRDSSYQIEISDTGIGMEEEEIQRLFSPFYTTKQKGNGLGLVEVQKIVQAHLGSIEVRSQPHRGSTFTITLPSKR